MSLIPVVAQYGPDQLVDTNGRPLSNVPVTIRNAAGALANLYQPGAPTEPGYARPTVPNPVETDQQGVFTFFADPGVYTVSAPGVTTYTVNVALPPVPTGVAGLKALPTGRYWTPPHSVALTQPAVGTLQFTRIIVAGTITIASLGVEVTTGGAAGSVVRLGVYNLAANLAFPGSLLVDAGTIAATSTGFIEKPIPGNQILTPGTYFLAVAPQVAGTTPVMRSANVGGVQMLAADYESSSTTPTDLTTSGNGGNGLQAGTVTAAGAFPASMTNETSWLTNQAIVTVVMKGA